MKPKKPFRDPRLKRGFWGIYSPTDAELPADLAALLAGWRARYERLGSYRQIKGKKEWVRNRAINPLQMDVSAILEALAEIPDDDANKAVRLLDSETYGRLKNATLLDYRREHPEPDPIPPDALSILWGYRGRARLSITPQRLRDLAALALSVLPKSAGGRPRKNFFEKDQQGEGGIDHFFACALVRYWDNLGKPIKGKLFKVWASDMFESVGTPHKDLKAILRRAIRICKTRDKW